MLHQWAGSTDSRAGGDPFELLSALESGADPNEARERDGRTPLMEASKHNNAIAARLLLRFGAKIDVADVSGRTALLDGSDLSMRRVLLDAGADPDFGRIGGMTPMAFFASFRDREMVEFFLAYGADTTERLRKGPTVQEALDDPDFVWNPFQRPWSPEVRQKNAEAILKHSDHLRISPEQYVTEHRNILIWSYGSEEYDDIRLKEWASRVLELLRSPTLLEEAYRQNLEGNALAEALRSLERPKWRVERERLRRARDKEFETFYFNRGDR